MKSSKAKMKSSPSDNLGKARALAERISKDFAHLSELTGSDRSKPIGSCMRMEEMNLIKVSDILSWVKYDLIAATDGRPAPLCFNDKDDWGECASPGHDEKAYITDRPVTADELIEIRNWIDAVLKWHESKKG